MLRSISNFMRNLPWRFWLILGLALSATALAADAGQQNQSQAPSQPAQAAPSSQAQQTQPAPTDQQAQKKNKKKKKNTDAQPAAPGPRQFNIDYSKLVWPAPPNITRVRYVTYLTGEKIDFTPAQGKKEKQGWMDRLAGTQTQDEKFNPKKYPFQLIGPWGIAVDSKGLVYVADQRVGAVFIFDAETKDTTLIRNGYDAHFGWINGLAIDDSDRLFVADGKMRRVMIFNPKHQVEGQITEGIVHPVGLAIDNENRFLYLADADQDQVLVYDADTLKLVRRIGTTGKNHTLTAPGELAGPQGVAVDKEGNVYITDTMNDRVQIFDADGKFISTFGKNGDGPGYFARPKGIAVDADGHIWVADQMQDRLQVFNREGQVLTYIGSGHGEFPGQFRSLVGVAIDKQNRVFTSEQEPGRVQVFRYVTDAEADAEKLRRQAELDKKAEERQKAATSPVGSATATPAVTATPASKPPDTVAKP